MRAIAYCKFLNFPPRQPDDGHHRPKHVVVQYIVIKLHLDDIIVFDYPYFPTELEVLLRKEDILSFRRYTEKNREISFGKVHYKTQINAAIFCV